MRWILGLLSLALVACGQSEPRANAAPDVPVAASPIQKCMNLGNALDSPEREGEWGYTIRRADMIRLKSAGFDTVRIPIRWSTRAGTRAPYTIEPDFLARVDEVVRWGGEIGLNVIINVHHYTELSERPSLHEQRLEAIWDQLAYHYVTAPDFLIFEVVNEPYGPMTVRRTDALNKRVLERIRQDNPDRWVILATANWGNLDGLKQSRPPYDRRAILTYHDYDPFEFTHQGAFWAEPVRPMGVKWGSRADYERLEAGLDQALTLQNKHRMPIFIGEFGVYEEVPVEERARWIRALRVGAEARGLGWCHWDWSTTLKAYDAEREQWLPEIKAALLD